MILAADDMDAALACHQLEAFMHVLVILLSLMFADSSDNPELKELFEQDQSIRQDDSFFKNAEQAHAFDQMRRMRVLRLLDDDVPKTANDFFHAAMVLQHGDSPLDYKLSNELCKKAVALDPNHKVAKWLAAASWDRYLHSIGKPQWYGTQFNIVDGKYYLMKADMDRVTDEERKAVGTRTIQEIKEFLKKQNKTDDVTLEPPPEEANVWNPGMRVPKMPTTQATTKP
jgi:hypothetical protein